METELDICELTPKEEIENRINRYREKMAGAGIDFSLIMGNTNLFYFSGTAQKGTLAITLDCEPLLFIEKNQERARRESSIPIIPITRDREMVDILKGKNILHGRGGLELDILPVTSYERLKQILAFGTFMDISSLIRQLRMIKSDFEIRQIKGSGGILDVVFKSAPEIIREGLREIDVEAELTAIGRRHGHQGFVRMRGLNQEMMSLYVTSGDAGTIPTYADVPIAGFGVTAAVPHGSSFKVIRRNQAVLLDYCAGYNGYMTDETRAYLIGSLESKLAKAYEVAREIIEETASFAREGTNSTEIFERARSRAKAADLDDYFMGHGVGKVGFIGHGVGLEVNELPVITPRHPQVLMEGMVFAFEPKFVFPGEGSIGVEADFIVRKENLERVTTTPLDLVQL